MTAVGEFTSADRDKRLKAALLGGVVVRLASFPLSFIATALATRALGPTQYGVLASAMAIMTMASISDFGVGRAMAMKLAQEHGRDDLPAMRRTVSSAFVTTLVMGLIVGGLVAVSVLWVPWASVFGAEELGNPTVGQVIIVLGVSMLLILPLSRGGAVLQGMQRDFYAQQWALGAIVMTLILTAGAYLAHANLAVFAIATLGAPVLVKVGEIVWTMVRVFPELRPRLADVDWPTTRELLKAGPSYVALHLSFLALSIDLVIVGHRAGADDAAIFAITVSLFTPVWSSLLMALQQMWPAMNEAVSRGDHDWVKTRLRKALIIGFALSASASIVVALIAKPITAIWVGHHYVAPTLALVLAVPWVIYSVLIFQIGSVLSATGRVREQGIIATLALFVNVAFVYYGVGYIGIAGAYAGSLLAYGLIVGVPSVWMLRKALRDLH